MEETPGTSQQLYSEETLQLAEKIEASFQKLSSILECVIEIDQFIKSNRIEKGSKEFQYVDEILTRSLIELDSVETHGVTEVKDYRRQVILKVNGIAAVIDKIRALK